MRPFLLTAMVLTLAGSAPAADPVSVPDTHKPFQGLWRPESIIFDGAEQIPTPQGKAALVLVIKGTDYKAYVCSNPGKGEYYKLFVAELSLDPAAKTFELTVKDGQKKGEKRHGVYDLSGTTLKLCYGPADQPRPTGFEPGKGTAVFVETWKLDRRPER